MVQKHAIILWRHAEDECMTFDDIAKHAFDTIDRIYNKYGIEYNPRYIALKGMKNKNVFEWNFSGFCDVLKETINREGSNVFPELGYNLTLYSSQNENKSFAYSLNVGIKNKRFFNSIVVDIPIGFDVFNVENAAIIEDMFIELIKGFQPYWGCVTNNAVAKKYGMYLKNNIPVAVYWLNYLSDELLNLLDVKKISLVLNKFNEISFESGVFKLQKSIFNAENIEESDRRLLVEQILLP